MNPNWLAIIAAILAITAFAFTYRFAARFPVRTRAIATLGASILALPGASFAFYYTHLLPELAWYYQFRSITGTEFLVIPIGIAGGLFATFLPRMLLGLPLFATAMLCIIPFVKPIVGPFQKDQLTERWRDDVCLQSTGSTCGPASLATVLNHLGTRLIEAEIVQRAHTYRNGTEAWYLARIARSEGYRANFEFSHGLSPQITTPCIAGVRLGAIGHFIPILDFKNDQFTIADPLRGKETLTRKQLIKRYEFTGFYLVVTD